MPETTELARIAPPGAKRLPPVGQWTDRFEIHSETSNRIYIIARNIQTGKFGCSCPSWRTRRQCKHLLDGCKLPTSKIHGYGQIAEKKKAGCFDD